MQEGERVAILEASGRVEAHEDCMVLDAPVGAVIAGDELLLAWMGCYTCRLFVSSQLEGQTMTSFIMGSVGFTICALQVCGLLC